MPPVPGEQRWACSDDHGALTDGGTPQGPQHSAHTCSRGCGCLPPLLPTQTHPLCSPRWADKLGPGSPRHTPGPPLAAAAAWASPPTPAQRGQRARAAPRPPPPAPRSRTANPFPHPLPRSLRTRTGPHPQASARSRPGPCAHSPEGPEPPAAGPAPALPPRLPRRRVPHAVRPELTAGPALCSPAPASVPTRGEPGLRPGRPHQTEVRGGAAPRCCAQASARPRPRPAAPAAASASARPGPRPAPRTQPPARPHLPAPVRCCAPRARASAGTRPPPPRSAPLRPAPARRPAPRPPRPAARGDGVPRRCHGDSTAQRRRGLHWGAGHPRSPRRPGTRLTRSPHSAGGGVWKSRSSPSPGRPHGARLARVSRPVGARSARGADPAERAGLAAEPLQGALGDPPLGYALSSVTLSEVHPMCVQGRGLLWVHCGPKQTPPPAPHAPARGPFFGKTADS